MAHTVGELMAARSGDTTSAAKGVSGVVSSISSVKVHCARVGLPVKALALCLATACLVHGEWTNRRHRFGSSAEGAGLGFQQQSRHTSCKSTKVGQVGVAFSNA